MIVDASETTQHHVPHFNDALAAVSLQRLSREPQFRILERRASAFYGRALRHFGRALGNREQSSSDLSLLCIRLLIIYSWNTMAPRRGSPHIGDDRPSISGQDHFTAPIERASASVPTPGQSSDADLVGLSTPTTSRFSNSPGNSVSPPDCPRTHDPANSAVVSHFEGLLSMLLVRGPEQTRNHKSSLLYHTTRDRVISNFSRRYRHLPISRSDPRHQWLWDSPPINMASALINVAIDLPLIRSRATILQRQANDSFRCQAAKKLKCDAHSLMSGIRAWYNELPDHWKEPRDVDMSSIQLWPGMKHGYEGLGYIYAEPLITMIIGRYHAYEIMLLQVICIAAEAETAHESLTMADSIVRSHSSLEKSEASSAIASQRTIVDVICAMIAVYNVRNDRVIQLGKVIDPGGLQHGGHLIEPVLISRTVPGVPKHQLRFLGLKMEELMGRV